MALQIFVITVQTPAPGSVVIPQVQVNIYDTAGVYITGGTTDGSGQIEFLLEPADYEARYFRAGYITPDPASFTVSETQIGLSAVYSDDPADLTTLKRGSYALLEGEGFDATPGQNTVTFMTEAGTEDKTGLSINAGRSMLLVATPSNAEFGNVLVTSITVAKTNPSPPPVNLVSGAVPISVEAPP